MIKRPQHLASYYAASVYEVFDRKGRSHIEAYPEQGASLGGVLKVASKVSQERDTPVFLTFNEHDMVVTPETSESGLKNLEKNYEAEEKRHRLNRVG